MRVRAEGDKGVETGYYGCVWCFTAARDYGKDVDLGTRPVLSNGIGEGVYLHESVVRFRRDCGLCTISIPISDSF
jgi:hypothetical protein